MFHNEIVKEKPQLHLCVFTWVWVSVSLLVCACVSYFRMWRFIVCTNFIALVLGNQLFKPVVTLCCCWNLCFWAKCYYVWDVSLQMRTNRECSKRTMLGKCPLNYMYWFIGHWFSIINWVISYELILLTIFRAHISVNLIAQSVIWSFRMLILGNDLKLNVQLAMLCTILMWRTLCEKLIDTATLSPYPSINLSSFFSRSCTHSLDYLGESSSDNSRIVIELKWNGTYNMCRSYWILLATKRHDMFMIIGNEIYGVLRSGAFALFMFGCACARMSVWKFVFVCVHAVS